MDKAKQDNTLLELYQQMENYLKRNSDRELFCLEPLPEVTENLVLEEA